MSTPRTQKVNRQEWIRGQRGSQSLQNFRVMANERKKDRNGLLSVGIKTERADFLPLSFSCSWAFWKSNCSSTPQKLFDVWLLLHTPAIRQIFVFAQSFRYLLICSFIHSSLHSPSYSPVHSFIHLFTHALTHPLIHSPSLHSPSYPPAHLSTYLLIHSLIGSMQIRSVMWWVFK